MTDNDPVLDGAAEILAAMKGIAPGHRQNALAMAIDAWVKTKGVLDVPARSATPTGDDYGGNVSPNHRRWEQYVAGSATPIGDDDV
jgi:hypothetical protein